MNSTLKVILIILVLLISIGFIFIPRIMDSKEEKIPGPAASEQKNQGLPVSAVVVKDVALDDNLRITGSLLANESVILRSEADGIVEKIYFNEGQRVKRGQLLVQLDNDEIAAEIEKLEHTLKLNENMEYRQKQLLEREAISQEEYENALTSLNTIRADLSLKKVQLSKRQIRAPFDGIIGLRSVSQGSYITSSVDIASLYSSDPIKIEFSVPGKYASQVNEKDKISFTIDGYSETFSGEIYAVEPQINPQTRTLQIRAMSPNKEGKLLPGQFAKIQLTLETYENALMVPSEAVIPELNGMKVFVYEDGLAQTKNIETGIRTADKIQVVSGLQAGDTLITTGMMQLQQGMPVNINLINEL